MRRLAPVLVLLILAPLSAAVLLGDVPLSQFIALPLPIGFYGTAALLIRELAVRRHLGRARIVLLGMAFGFVAEGLVFQSLFNPHFPGAGFFAVYGRSLGTNWYWVEYVVGWHAIWSISLPILLTEILFPGRRNEAWLGRIGLVIISVIFVLACALGFFAYDQLTKGFHASPLLLAGAAVAAILLFLLALFLPTRAPASPTQPKSRKAQSPWLIGLLAFVAGGIWLGNHEFITPGIIIPAPLLILLLALLALAVVLIIRRWSTQDFQWGIDKDWRLSLAPYWLEYLLASKSCRMVMISIFLPRSSFAP
ncbi:hypothetical protein EPA93_46805 [Ktedonosporobacter rubrisoli]|uniref:Uncharacterized protein n=1 Tax=Ktedonosporobacter rubrisoli TaxID=2509675 RepID=A0A4P6K4C9_KTERU|nr:hypothetical protein [Ktedonosporobacter rubrisoli]QBD83079.1 hypothetical protein EPA93_46805 [Ktedonosporobacter rubrisoli]